MHTHNKNMAEAKTIQRGKAYVIILTHNLHTRREVHSLIVLGYKIFPNKIKKNWIQELQVNLSFCSWKT